MTSDQTSLVLTQELKVRLNRKGGWKKEIQPTQDKAEFQEQLQAIIDEVGSDTRGKFFMSYKTNGGASSNRDMGTTLNLNWGGPFGEMFELIPIMKVPEE